MLFECRGARFGGGGDADADAAVAIARALGDDELINWLALPYVLDADETPFETLGAATAALTWHHRLRIAFDISAALYYLHACHCAFADLTSAAVLLDAAGQPASAGFEGPLPCAPRPAGLAKNGP